MDAPHLLSLETAAARLAVSTRTLRRLLAAGDLPSVRIRAARRILASDLSTYIASKSTVSDNQPGVAVNGETKCHEQKYATKTEYTGGRTRLTGGPASRALAGAALAEVLGFPSPRIPRA